VLAVRADVDVVGLLPFESGDLAPDLLLAA
jgi:hypothetical protein